MNIRELIATSALALGLFSGGSAGAAPVLCQTITNNHMFVDSTIVSTCVDAGVGNIGQGNQSNDDFLNQLGQESYVTLTGTSPFTQTGATGTFSIDSTFWDSYQELFIGFKFGTGNQPDEWFVYQLQDLVSTGSWQFVNVHGTGGGLSHAVVYAQGPCDQVTGCDRPPQEIPEPASIALVGLGLLGAALVRRRRPG